MATIAVPPKTKADAKATTEAIQAGSAPDASNVQVAAGTDGLTAGDLQTVLQSLATRIAAVETP
ncbi:hypothetical protein GUH47_28875 [Xanthomonas citri pv. citri]|nr:hypothetical protein ART_00117 [Achromobacter phage vB_Ade_ART]MBD4209905.1 hypothetical protein [Xanthomonas citri pv. citri]